MEEKTKRTKLVLNQIQLLASTNNSQCLNNNYKTMEEATLYKKTKILVNNKS